MLAATSAAVSRFAGRREAAPGTLIRDGRGDVAQDGGLQRTPRRVDRRQGAVFFETRGRRAVRGERVLDRFVRRASDLAGVRADGGGDFGGDFAVGHRERGERVGAIAGQITLCSSGGRRLRFTAFFL